MLAGSQYRQQIEADIKPFEGILLGIFFMTSGANLDPVLCLQEWPTLLSGILAVLGAKLGLIFVLGAFGFGLTRAEAIRIALLLAGGGEFAFVVFKLAEELELLEPKLSSLLTAAVIISMSLTPLLGEAAQYVSEAVERIDSKSTANVRADELFDVIDADGNGSIEKEELLSYLLGGGTAIGATRQNEAFDRLFTMLDLDGDGVISRQELRAGFTELICGEMREVALQDATGVGGGAPAADDALATEPDAVVVCGYGEMGQLACDVLADAEGVGGGAGAGELRDQVALPTGAWGTRFIAVDRNPSRVSIGLAKQVRVVYGDGASVELLRAAGVIRPRHHGDLRQRQAMPRDHAATARSFLRHADLRARTHCSRCGAASASRCDRGGHRGGRIGGALRLISERIRRRSGDGKLSHPRAVVILKAWREAARRPASLSGGAA